jgi:filamentous hemagglutinin
MADVQAQTQITAAFGSAAAKQVGDYATQRYKEAQANGDPVEAAKWAEGGEYRIALHTGVGLLAGGLPGAAGAATSAAVMPGIGKAITDMNVPEPVKQALGAVAAMAIGAAVGGVAGVAAGVNIDLNNRQLHPTEIDWIKANASRYAALKGINVADAQTQLAEQAYRQVQFGAEGGAASWDATAQNFLKTAGTQTLATGGYMFYATPTQRANSLMYLDSAVDNAAFYAVNGLVPPTAADIQRAATRDAQIRANLSAATNTAFVASATLALAGLSPAALNWALANPIPANLAGVITAETAAAITSGAVTPSSLVGASVGTRGAVKSVEVVKAEVAVAKEAGSIRDVNVIGGTMNCVNCVVATDAMLAGRPASALPGGPYRISVLENLYGATFSAPSPIGSVTEAMAAAGPNARGIVFGSRGSEVGHVFNVVNQNGVIRFLDGQTGQPASLGGFNSFQLLRTN